MSAFPKNLGYDEAAVEKLRLNQGKQLFDDLKDSVEKGRSLDIQDGMGATAVSLMLFTCLLFHSSFHRDADIV